jgi:mannose-1-phosphate guanylyltransferase
MDKLIVVSNQDHRFMVAEQLKQLELGQSEIILEPVGKNTAPAIALAAFSIVKNYGDELMLVLPADHVIEKTEEFCEALRSIPEEALQEKLITFGIKASGPETGYGYIKAGETLGERLYEIAEFKEKPELDVARDYVASGNYFWNSGMFLFRASTFLAELKTYSPEIFSACLSSIDRATVDLDFIRVDESAFRESPAESVDIAVFEKTERSAVVPLDIGWNDVGSWSALWEVSNPDSMGNVTRGDVMAHSTTGSYIHSETKLVTTVGVQDLIIVETDDALLVANKNESQGIKELVQEMVLKKRTQVSHHRKVHRPWGWYDSLDFGEKFQVKRIQVKPLAKLSVQKHHRRAEHWVVVSGTAEVRNGDSTFLLNENESTYIPIGTIHSLRNPSETNPLEIIEVQTGTYLGEDDIVRYEDDYGRV